MGLKMTYLGMVTDAIVTMKEHVGSSRQAIILYIVDKYKIEDSKMFHIRKALAVGIKKRVLKKARASGKGAGRFRVVKIDKSKPKKIIKASAKSSKKNMIKKLPKKTAKTAVMSNSKAEGPLKKAAKKAVKKASAKKPKSKAIKLSSIKTSKKPVS